MRLVALVLVSSVAGCHLAEDVAGPSCDGGMRASNGQCAAEPIDGPTITISAGASCAPTPASITVAVNGSFRFQNDDDAEHVISGSDGMAWVSALSHQASPFIGITRAGSWPYSISGCSGVGVIVVQ